MTDESNEQSEREQILQAAVQALAAADPEDRVEALVAMPDGAREQLMESIEVANKRLFWERRNQQAQSPQREPIPSGRAQTREGEVARSQAAAARAAEHGLRYPGQPTNSSRILSREEMASERYQDPARTRARDPRADRGRQPKEPTPREQQQRAEAEREARVQRRLRAAGIHGGGTVSVPGGGGAGSNPYTGGY